MLKRICAVFALITGLGQVSAADIPNPPGFKGKIAREGAASQPYWPPEVKAPPGAPNILIWLIDDSGFGQNSAYGGLVHTPTIEHVAAEGLRYTDFNVTALCSPTRASLLTGRNHHAVDMGSHVSMESGYPGYNGRIPKSAATLARHLQMNGYATFALGKWDVTPGEYMTPVGPFDYWPSGQGFDHYYGFLSGEVPQFEPALWSDHSPIDPAVGKPNYHLTTDLADKAIEWITAQKSIAPTRPFFLYWATGAVHAPHQAPPEYIAKYKGKFDIGWDEARKMVLANQKKMGLMPETAELPDRPAEVPAWDSLAPDEKKMDAREMEALAGQFEHADHEFGRIVDTLKRTGQLDNTIIIILADNGASAEGGLHGTFNEFASLGGKYGSNEDNLRHYDEWGSKKTHNHYAVGWALAGNTPFNYYKQTTYGGGVRVPFIISWPGHLQKNQMRGQFQHITDLMPTLLGMVGVRPAEVVDGVKQQRIDGVDMSNTFADPKAPTRKTVQYFEMFGNRGIWENGWKAVTLSTHTPWDVLSPRDLSDDHWQLFHIDEDINERLDLAAKNPQKLAEMKALFHKEALRNNVYPLWPNDRQQHIQRVFDANIQANKGHFVYYSPGAQRISTVNAPPLAAHSYTLSAEIEIPKGGAEGVIAAVGGRTGGYSLFVANGGKPVFVYNSVGEGEIALQGPVLRPGAHRLSVVYEMTGKTSAKAKLVIDDKPASQADIARTFSPFMTETLDIGRDTGTPVSDTYAAPFAFTGGLSEVTVDVAKP